MVWRRDCQCQTASRSHYDSLKLRIARASLTKSEDENLHKEYPQYITMAADRDPHKLGQHRDTEAHNELPTQSISKKHRQWPHLPIVFSSESIYPVVTAHAVQNQALLGPPRGGDHLQHHTTTDNVESSALKILLVESKATDNRKQYEARGAGLLQKLQASVASPPCGL